MLAFLSAGALLLLGSALYGRLCERAIRPDPRRITPAVALANGVDFVAMPTWRVYLIQLLNIAGLGPVFGPIMGALWGPQVFLWVVLGTILGGGVHDLLAGAMSVRNGGAGLPDLVARYLGRPFRHLAVGFILALMLLVGTVFVRGPALLVVQLLPAEGVGRFLGGGAAAWLDSTWAGQSTWLWVVMAAIFVYYILATLLPIDVLIGRVYPFFAAALLVMVAGLAWALLFGRLEHEPFTLANLHPTGLPAWPLIFITVSCGAVSGFHGTQSPLMARCLVSERHLRVVFYGAMVAEGFIALVWAAAAPAFYGSVGALSEVLSSGGPGQVVHDVCVGTMGVFGGVIAILGVVVLPVTSGDTAFRVGRLVLADYLGLPQQRIRNRYLVALPLFAASFGLMLVDFSVIWRYFGWANQTLAAVTLWAGAVYLARRRSWWWLAALPATFMTAMTVTYILVEEIGFGLPPTASTAAGAVAGASSLIAFLLVRPRLGPEDDGPVTPAPLSPAERAADDLAC